MPKNDKELLLNGTISDVVVNEKTGLIELFRVDNGKTTCIVYVIGNGIFMISQTRGD